MGLQAGRADVDVGVKAGGDRAIIYQSPPTGPDGRVRPPAGH